jgi:hypothetical protein
MSRWQLWPLIVRRQGYADAVVELALPFARLQLRYFRKLPNA